MSHLGSVLNLARPPLVQWLESGIIIGLQVQVPRQVVSGPEVR